jgi:hypothetical protein
MVWKNLAQDTDRDKLWLVYTQIVPVIFEPPCNKPLGSRKGEQFLHWLRTY